MKLNIGLAKKQVRTIKTTIFTVSSALASLPLRSLPQASNLSNIESSVTAHGRATDWVDGAARFNGLENSSASTVNISMVIRSRTRFHLEGC
jgi:hypothetical protein